MPSIAFDVVSATVSSRFGDTYKEAGPGEWLLNLALKPAPRERIELGTGEHQRDLEFSATFRETEPALVKWVADHSRPSVDGLLDDPKAPPIGMFSYHAAWSDPDGFTGGRAALLAEIYTPADVMRSLIRFAENGRFPRRLHIDIRGLDYGYAPDGSEKKWTDNGEKTPLAIINVDYTLPLTDPLPEPEDEAPNQPLTPVGADLAPILRETLKWVRWSVYALILVAVGVLFSRR